MFSALTVKRKIVFYVSLSKHKDTPFIAKCLLSAAIAYLLSPIDLIPDFIPVLGQLDDLIIVPFLIWLALTFVPSEVKDEVENSIP